MNVKIYLFVTVFLGFITSINAQSYELSGVINDEKNDFYNILDSINKMVNNVEKC